MNARGTDGKSLNDQQSELVKYTVIEGDSGGRLQRDDVSHCIVMLKVKLK